MADCIEAPMREAQLSLTTQAALYIAGGINHFWHQSFYVSIMPDHYSHPAEWVQFTGLAEIAGGLGLLIPATRRPAAIGILLMLAVYFDVHVFMLAHAERFPHIPRWALWARLPLQFALMAWAWNYARKQSDRITAPTALPLQP